MLEIKKKINIETAMEETTADKFALLKLRRLILQTVKKELKVRRGVDLLQDFLKQGFKLNKEDRYRYFDVSLTPWLLEVAKWVDDTETEWIYLLQGSQTGKTTFLMAFLLFIAQRQASRVVLVFPTEEEGRNFVTERLRPFIDNFDEKMWRKTGYRNRILAFKLFDARIKLAYASSTVSLRSVPARYVVGDEIGIWRYSTALLKKRTRTFLGERKGVFATTPPDRADHHAWQEALSGAVYQWFVPCPRCQRFQGLEFQGLKWTGKREDGTWDLYEVERTTKYQCGFCSALWGEEEKQDIIRRGKMQRVNNEFQPVDRDPADSQKALHINALYSSFMSWGKLASMFLEAKVQGVEALQVFITDELAQIPSSREEDEQVLNPEIYVDNSRVSGWRGGYKLYSVGVDVQRDGTLYVVVLGWQSGKKISAHLLFEKISAWKQEGRIDWTSFVNLLSPYLNSIYRVCIDASDGQVTQDIYDFCQKQGSPFFPINDSGSTYSHRFHISFKKVGLVYKQQLISINSSLIKDEIAAALSRPFDDEAWTFPCDVSEVFLKHFSNEHRIVETVRGRKRLVWRPRYTRAPQHFFSAYVYAVAAIQDMRSYLLGVEQIKRKRQRKLRVLSKGLSKE